MVTVLKNIRGKDPITIFTFRFDMNLIIYLLFEIFFNSFQN